MKNICWAAASENQRVVDKFTSSHPEVFCKKGVLRNFAKFTVKHLCQKEAVVQRCSVKKVFLEISQNSPLVAASADLPKEGNFWFFLSFKFCYGGMVLSCNHVTCFSKVYRILFFLVQTWYFYHKKVVTWKLQHFYHKEVMMLSFLHLWDYCWKCEFDIDAKIDNYNHRDGEQLLFYKKVQISKHRAKRRLFL